MRWRIQLSYLGTHYVGWQRQPNGRTVQQELEEAFQMILRQPVEVTGCGRTDTGVHASVYIAHADVAEVSPSSKLMYQLNAVLPNDIAIQSISETTHDFHARFDAIARSYTYHVHFSKNPFLESQSFFFPHHQDLDFEKMQHAAKLLLTYDRFQPFCKTGSDAEHYQCRMMASEWSVEEDRAVYHVRANRFLRGMVRLIVGACLNAGLGEVTVEEIRMSLEKQTPLDHPWSVPPEGLFLTEVQY